MKYAICAYFFLNIYVIHYTYIYTPKVGDGLLKLVILTYLKIFCKGGLNVDFINILMVV